MATIEQLGVALKNADAAGDVNAARALAQALKQMRGQQQDQIDPNQANAELSALTQQAGAGQAANLDQTDNRIRANMEATKIGNMTGNRAQPIDPLGGFTDELYASTLGAGARMFRDGVGYGEARNREQMLLDTMQERSRKAHPIQSAVNDVAGGLMLGGAMTKGGLTLAGKSLPVIGKTGAAALEGAGYGALMGAGQAKQGEKTSGAVTGGIVGGLTAGALSKVGDIAGKIAAKRTVGPAPTTDDIFAKGTQLYQEAKAAGVGVKPATVQKVSGNVKMKMSEFDLDPVLQPKTSHLVSRIEAAAKANKPLSLMELENLRKQAVRITQDATEASEKSAAGKIIETIDSVMDDSGNFSVNSNDGLRALSEARKAWKTARKSEILDEIAFKAQNQATGYENGLIVQMRALANNKQKMKAFSPEEQKAIVDTVRRGSVRGILAMIGRLSPNSTFGGITTGGAMVGSGVVPGAALGATGYVAKKGAEALTRGKFNAAKDLVARGAQAMPQSVNRLAPYTTPGALTATGLLLPYALPTKQPTR